MGLRINSKKYFNKHIILIKYRDISMIIRLSLTLCFYKRDLHQESCRVEGLNTRELSN